MAFFCKLKNKAAFKMMVDIMKSAASFRDFACEMQNRGMVIKGSEVEFYFDKNMIPVEVFSPKELRGFLESVKEFYPSEFKEIAKYIRSTRQGVKGFAFPDKIITIIKDTTTYGLVTWR